MSPRQPAGPLQYICVADEVANVDHIDACSAWEAALLAPSRLSALEAFVSEAMHSKARYMKNMRGSFNLVLEFRVRRRGSEALQVVLRLPMHGFRAPSLMAEMLESEVAWLQYFAAHAIAPVPAVYAWSSVPADGDDVQVGCPYILMEFVEGEALDACLLRWEDSPDPADAVRRRAAFEDMAALYLAMYRRRFDAIGAVRATDDGGWAVTQRPLTQAMHDVALYAPDEASVVGAWPRGPLATAADYKALFLQMHITHQHNLRNINVPGTWTQEASTSDNPSGLVFRLQTGDEIDMGVALSKAAGRIVARHGFTHPACAPYLAASDTGPFRLFNHDMQPRNMLVDPDTGRLVALLDLEGTNALPAVFAQDPPLYLCTYNLFKVIAVGKLDQWKANCDPTMDMFLGILQRLEGEQHQEEEQHQEVEKTPLSTLMRASWESKQWLLHFAMHDLNMADSIFWGQDHYQVNLAPKVDHEELGQEIEAYEELTIRQIAAYEKDRIAGERR